MSFHDEFVQYIADNNINIASFGTKQTQLMKFEEKHRKPVESGEYTRDDYLAYFRFTSPRSPSFFDNRKAFIKHYISFLVERGVAEASQFDIVNSISFKDIGMGGVNKIQYFKDITHLSAVIDQTLSFEEERKLQTINDKSKISEVMHSYDTPVCIYYCIWFGLTLEQIVKIKADDLMDDGVIVDGKMVYMPRNIVKKLMEYKISDGYYHIGRGLIYRPYVPSEYLMRTYLNDKLTVEGARVMLTRFNKICDNKYSLNLETVYTSGMFYRAYQAEQNGLVDFGIVANRRTYFGDKDSSDATIAARYTAYQEYKKTFYPD